MSNTTAALVSSDKNNETSRFKRPYGQPRKRNNEVRHNQIGDQLGALFNLTKGREGHVRDINSLGVEGVDHINVSRHSTTQLGFLLAPTTKLGFKLFGRNFSTVENLLMYYRSWCTIDSLATADYTTINELRNGSLKDFPHFANIYVVVCLAYVSIFKKHQAMFKAMESNMLVLDSYKEQHKVRTRPNTGLILVRAINEAYSSVAENRKPNLSIFMGREDVANLREIYDDMPYNPDLSFNQFVEDCFAPDNIKEVYKQKHARQEEPQLQPEEEVVDLADSVITQEAESNVTIEETATLDPQPDDEAAQALSDVNSTQEAQ